MVRAILADSKTQTRRLATSRPTQRFEIGDRLWVRESFAVSGDPGGFAYMADHVGLARFGWSWKPSIHMPRAASRLILTVTDIRTQPLQDIDEADARAEGVTMVADRNYRDGYAVLWNSLHTKAGGRWDDNPDVIAVTFTVERRNIDTPAGSTVQ